MTILPTRKYLMGKLVKPEKKLALKRKNSADPVILPELDALMDSERREICRFQDLRHED